MKQAFFIFISVALFSCGSSSTSSKTTDSTTTTSESTKTEKAAVVAKPATAWTFKTDTDKMTSKQRHYAQVTSDAKLDFPSPYDGGSTATLVVRNQNQGDEVLVQVDKGQFLGGENHDVNVRFDSDQPIKFHTSEPSDGSSEVLFIESSPKFIKHLKAAKKVIVQAEFYEAGAKDIEFNVDGFKWK